MANPNFGGNNFSPQGAKQVSVIGQRPQLSGASLQGQGTVSMAPAFNAQPTMAPEAPVAPAQAQAQIGAMNTPRGAQPVALAGQKPQQAAMPVPPAQQMHYAPPPQHQIPQQQAPQQHPSLGAGEEIHVILVRGLGRDNREYVAEFDAVFPVGTRILGVSERPPA
jgi:hypothetical protein